VASGGDSRTGCHCFFSKARLAGQRPFRVMLMDFPCDIPVKIFGRNSAGFRDAVFAILREHFADLTLEQISEQPSRRGNYLSITVTVSAASREQIDEVYRDLTASESVMMVL
jgi:uncharacterized protein